MSWRKDSLFRATLYLEAANSPPDWQKELLRTLPEAYPIRYFAKSERLRKRAECAVIGENDQGRREYLDSRAIYFFFGDDYKLFYSSWARGMHRVDYSSQSLITGSKFIRDWIPHLNGWLYFSFACIPAESDHRNGYSQFIQGGHSARGWIGLDYERYVPGLYWLNYFSDGFINRHNINCPAIAENTGGKAIRLDHGYLVQLYDSPAMWVKWKDRVDDHLYNTPGFFSKRRVDIPQDVPPWELNDAMRPIYEQWP